MQRDRFAGLIKRLRKDYEWLREGVLLDAAECIEELRAEAQGYADIADALAAEKERLRATLARAPRPAPPFDPVPYIDWYFKDRSAVLGDDEGIWRNA